MVVYISKKSIIYFFTRFVIKLDNDPFKSYSYLL